MTAALVLALESACQVAEVIRQALAIAVAAAATITTTAVAVSAAGVAGGVRTGLVTRVVVAGAPLAVAELLLPALAARALTLALPERLLATLLRTP